MTDLLRLQRFAEKAANLQREIDAAGFGNPVKRECDELRAEVDRLRTALRGIADNPDPVDSKRCYCRWSRNVARAALADADEGRA